MRPILCTLACLAAVSSPAWAACDAAPSATVCDSGCDHDNLQDAVSAAASGDVLCIEGDFTQTAEHLDVEAKALTIQHDGVGVAAIRTGALEQVVVRGGGSLALQGVTIDGSAGSSTGIAVEAGTFDGTDLHVHGHFGAFKGAGLRVDVGTGTCSGCTFEDNTATNRGGHVFVDGDAVGWFEGGAFRRGAAEDGGGFAVRGALVVTDATLADNQAGVDGGAVFADGASAIDISGSIFEGNWAGREGGAIHFRGASSATLGSLFCGNHAVSRGGALQLRGDSAEVRGSIFLDNTCDGDGGGIHSQEGVILFANLAFVGNDAGAVYNRAASGPLASGLFVGQPDTAVFMELGGPELQADHNLYFGNGVDFGGAAAAGPNDVFGQDPRLDDGADCSPERARPTADVASGVGDPSLGDDAAGGPNSIGAFGGPIPFDIDVDGDGHGASTDCDERDPLRHPGAPEVCDGQDTNCNGQVDDGCEDCATDMCGTCDTDPTNDCQQDCAGVWGGEATEDACGVCDADPSNDCADPGTPTGDNEGTDGVPEGAQSDDTAALAGACGCATDPARGLVLRPWARRRR